LVSSRRDGPGSGAVQHGDGSAGAPPRGVAIGARIERAGCCAAPLARRSSSTSRIGRCGARRAHARLCERRGVLPARRRVRDFGRKGALGRERVGEVVEFGRRRDVLRKQRLPRRRRAPRRHDGRRRRLGARCRRRRAEHGVRIAVQRAPQHESWLVERRGSAARRVAARRRVVHPVRVVCARQSGSSGAGVTALEREPTIKRQRVPPFPRAARNFKCKMTPNPLPPAKTFARERANHHPRSLCERRAVARARRTTQRGLAQPPRPATLHSNGGLELPVSVRSSTALRARPHFPLPASSAGLW
jgi:hypothetical protein